MFYYFLNKKKFELSLVDHVDLLHIIYSYLLIESVQEQPPRRFSKISVLFFQEHLFLDFSRRLYVFTEQILIFQEGIFFRRTDTIFPGANFMCSPNRYRFSKSPYFGYRTGTDFPGAPF